MIAHSRNTLFGLAAATAGLATFGAHADETCQSP